MRKYSKPIINIEELEIKEVIAALSNANNGGGIVDLNDKDIMSWEDFWNQ